MFEPIRSSASTRADAKRAELLKDERPIHVLVVDDHELTREMYAAYLAHLGMVVYAAADGREAIVKLLGSVK